MEANEHVAAPRRPVVVGSPQQRETVLVIDHDNCIRSLIAEFRGQEGYTVREAACGSAGLDLTEQLRLDVFASISRCQWRSGLEVLQGLKERQSTRHSGHRRRRLRNVATALRGGARGWLSAQTHRTLTTLGSRQSCRETRSSRVQLLPLTSAG